MKLVESLTKELVMNSHDKKPTQKPTQSAMAGKTMSTAQENDSKGNQSFQKSSAGRHPEKQSVPSMKAPKSGVSPQDTNI